MSKQILPLFASHPRHWRDNRYVYPVISRRSAGLSIGINLNPDKACNFDCVYCSVDRRMPDSTARQDVDLEVLEAELAAMLELATTGGIFNAPPFDQTPAALRRLNDVAFSGDGEPTACPGFADACRLVVRLLASHDLEHVRPVVITNATLLDRPSVRRGIDLLYAIDGRIWGKLDAGTEPYYRQVERTTIPLRRVLDNLLSEGRRHPIVIQSMFISLHGEEPSSEEIEQYIERLKELLSAGCQIERVQVYTLARPPAESWAGAVPTEVLEEIAMKIRDLHIEAETYPGQ